MEEMDHISKTSDHESADDDVPDEFSQAQKIMYFKEQSNVFQRTKRKHNILIHLLI